MEAKEKNVIWKCWRNWACVCDKRQKAESYFQAAVFNITFSVSIITERGERQHKYTTKQMAFDELEYVLSILLLTSTWYLFYYVYNTWRKA